MVSSSWKQQPPQLWRSSIVVVKACIWLSCASDAFVAPIKAARPQRRLAGQMFHRHATPTHNNLICLHMSSTSSSHLATLFDELSSKVTEKLGLQTTDFTESYGGKTWSDGTQSGTAEWLTEISPKLLTGVSLLSRTTNDGSKQEWTMNIW